MLTAILFSTLAAQHLSVLAFPSNIASRQEANAATFDLAQNCFGGYSLPNITASSVTWTPEPGEYRAKTIMNSVIRATWLSDARRVADLVGPGNCDVHLLTEYTQPGAPAWYRAAADIAEQDFQARGQGSLERAWQLMTNASIDFIDLPDCEAGNIKKVADVLATRGTRQPLTVQWNPAKMPDPTQHDTATYGNGSILNYGAVYGTSDGGNSVNIGAGDSAVSIAYPLQDLCKADFVVWGPSCNVTVPQGLSEDETVKYSCFGPYKQQ